MKKLDKILSVIMVVVMLSSALTNICLAGGFSIDSIKSNEPLGQADNALTKVGSTILTLVTNVGMILAVVVIAILGVKYMMGSTEEKAEYKKTMMPYFIGAVLVFGASFIGKAVRDFASNLSGSAGTP